MPTKNGILFEFEEIELFKRICSEVMNEKKNGSREDQLREVTKRYNATNPRTGTRRFDQIQSLYYRVCHNKMTA